MACVICGGTALYRCKSGEFCKAHKNQAMSMSAAEAARQDAEKHNWYTNTLADSARISSARTYAKRKERGFSLDSCAGTSEVRVGEYREEWYRRGRGMSKFARNRGK